jgi:hypothetical protein
MVSSNRFLGMFALNRLMFASNRLMFASNRLMFALNRSPGLFAFDRFPGLLALLILSLFRGRRDRRERKRSAC